MNSTFKSMSMFEMFDFPFKFFAEIIIMCKFMSCFISIHIHTHYCKISFIMIDKLEYKFLEFHSIYFNHDKLFLLTTN
ncbi:hypothetical protein MIMI-R681 [Acanthamoeba polyphaga mimivirus]|uniref:Uncharacterized protein n=1 Tax=Acanthamoeba polyphaga mimivirus TaxID=212035 RepID=E5L7Z1_MIMIV|nr:hypothetical protein MIMI_gp0748 [Acanthamoeba polyphaga mimivirus]ADQ48143.1 hypothetical protein [Acanthamoeba polyphaga mimivirus]UTE96771.1 hypothetical protein MIMI-R681 [Acanthamoeba polyphaga mimivirus]